MTKKRLTIEEREKLIADYRASEKTQTQWCEEKGIGKATLSGWLKKVDDRLKMKHKSEQPFLSVQVTEISTSPITIEIGNCKIRVEEQFSKQLLSEVLMVVVATC